MANKETPFKPLKLDDCYEKIEVGDYQPSFYRLVNSIDDVFGLVDQMEQRMKKSNRWIYN